MGSDHPLSPSIQIRPSVESDLPALLSIYNDTILTSTATLQIDPISMNERQKWLLDRSEKYPVYSVWWEGMIVGWGSLSPWSDRAGYAPTAEPSLYLVESAQGKGWGKALLSHLVLEARRLGFHSLVSRISGDNPISLRLHERCGFKSVGLLEAVGRKFDRWVDVHLYQILLRILP